ncbi:MAG: CHASE2 domain-containing protein [Candidatus Gracilibacteria bacterium]
MKASSKSRIFQISFIALLISIFLFAVELAGGFTSWHLKISNFLYSYQTSYHTGDVVVVKIDEESLKAQSEGGLGRWQNWRRTYFAQVVQNLQNAGAKVIGIDVLFTEPANEAFTGVFEGDENEEKLKEILANDDKELGKKIALHPDIVLAAKEGTPALIPVNTIYDSKSTSMSLGSVYVPLDTDATVRNIPLKVNSDLIKNSFSLEIIRRFFDLSSSEITAVEKSLVILKDKIKNPDTGKNYGPIIIPMETEYLYTNFFGPANSIPSVSFVKVYNNDFSPELFKNKIVLIGEMNAGLHDEVSAPVSFGTLMPGVELHANAIETMLTNKGLQSVPIYIEFFILLLLSIFASLLFYRMRPWVSGICMVLLMAGYIVAALWFFNELQIVLNTLFPPLALLLTFITVIIYKYIREERTKNKITAAFSHYVSDKVVRKIIDHPSMISLGGEKKHMSVSFTDIAGFTTISETRTPEEVVDFLHVYLERMTSIILKYEGTLDKYIGDAIMAFWGAPIDLKEHAVLSCRSALSMHKEMNKLVTDEETMNTFAGVGIRTGIASGDMVVGNIGSKKRFDYTVIGDTVNLASRLEGVNKVYGTEICVSENTKILSEKEFVFRILDRIKVKGKNQPIQIYELIEERSLADTPLLKYIQDFEKVYELYLAKEFVEAKKHLARLIKIHPNDSVLKLYKSRIEEYIKNPPEKDWDGVHEMKTK